MTQFRRFRSGQWKSRRLRLLRCALSFSPKRALEPATGRCSAFVPKILSGTRLTPDFERMGRGRSAWCRKGDSADGDAEIIVGFVLVGFRLAQGSLPKRR